MEIKTNHDDKNLSKQNTFIVSKIKDTIKKHYNLEAILSELPKGSILVGGYIRDLILDRLSPYPDIDIVIPNNSQEIGKNIARKFSGKFLIIDKNRSIVRIIFKDFAIDIANQTHDLLADDLKNRDFTINSIGFSFDHRKLIDPTNGLNDLKNSLLRSFRCENLLYDPLRILRCFRFVSELNFHIEPQILKFIELNKFQLKAVSVERIQYELKKIVQGKEALKTVECLNEIKIFNWVQSYENSHSSSLSFKNFDLIKQFNSLQSFLPLNNFF